MKTSLANKKGFILFSVICICLVFIIVILPLINWTVNEFSWTTRSFMSLRALNLADAGAELAVWEIVHNSAQFTGWTGVNPKTRSLSSFTDNLGETIGDISVTALTLSPDNYLITSSGLIPNAANPSTAKTVKVRVFPHRLFNNGLFGDDSVTLNGNAFADSYDSSLGPYSSLLARDNADVGTNGTLSMVGNSHIHGDVFVGEEGSLPSGTESRITGDVNYFGEVIELDPVPQNKYDYLSALPNPGGLSLKSNDTQTLPTGNYHYSSISVSGNAVLTFAVNCHILLDGDFSTSGNGQVVCQAGAEFYIGGSGSFSGNGIVNTAGIPADVQLYGLGEGTSFDFTGNSNFSGTVYAPGSSVKISGNGAFFGAVVGNDITISGNGGFHYDESLASSNLTSGYDIAYWQED